MDEIPPCPIFHEQRWYNVDASRRLDDLSRGENIFWKVWEVAAGIDFDIHTGNES